MLTPEDIERYRKMTPGERLKETFELNRKYQHCLYKGTPYQIKRRFERMRQSKNEANRRILEAFARLEASTEENQPSSD